LLSLAIRQDCYGKAPYLLTKILAYPARSGNESPFFQPEGHPPKLSMIPLLVTLTAVTRVARRFLVN